MSTKTLSGFFYISGGIDRPVGYDDNLNFGFDHNTGSGPIFKYSVNSVVKFFNDPISIAEISKDTLKKNNILNILIDGSIGTNSTDYSNITDDQFAALKLDDIFKALEYLYNNQGIIANTTGVDLTKYSNVGDKFLQDNIGGSYVATSLIITPSVLQSRVAKVTFELVYSENPDTHSKVYGSVEFYFTPDDMFIAHGLDFDKCAIVEDITNYQYVDPNLPNPIEPFIVPLEKIADPEILKDYSNYSVYKTTHIILGNNGSPDTKTSQQFFILHNMCRGSYVPVYEQIISVKQYLINKYSSDYTLLKRIYPDLFSDSSVEIYPMMYNTMVDTTLTNRSNIVTPVRLVDIIGEMERRGIPTTDLEYSGTNVEIFLINGLSKYDDNLLDRDPKDELFRIPLLAINMSSIPTNGFIGSLYPNFAIRAAGMPIVGADWEVFQFYVKLFVKILLGMNPGDFNDKTDPELQDILKVPANFSLKTTKFTLFGVEYLDSISFTFNGVEFTVHGYNYGEIHDNQ